MNQPDLTEAVTGDGVTLDRISDLPESLLVRIISLLSTTEEACRTSLVSKRWQYLWTCIDTLSFVYTKDDYKLRGVGESEAKKFISLVDYVFAKRTYSKITNFHLVLLYPPRNILPVEKWLSYAIKYKVEHLVFNSEDGGMYTLPQLFYTCSSLISLHLFRCAFDKGAVILWKSLKTLKLSIVELDDELFVKLLSGCPALETMELSVFRGSFHRMEINNSNLKTLKLHEFWSRYGKGNHLMEIVAPYLQHLEISGDMDNVKFSLVNVSSLVSARLTFFTNSESRFQGYFVYVQDYIKKLRHVTELKIGTWFAEALFMLLQDGVQLPEMKCKCLTLSFQITKYTFYGVASLLQASPHVEALNIGLGAQFSRFRWYYESSYMPKGDSMDLENWLSNLALPSLKRTNVICSTIRICWRDQRHAMFFELLKFLLKNATVLEKFVITTKKSKCSRCSENCCFQYSSELAVKLLGCQRASTNFMITFHESNFP